MHFVAQVMAGELLGAEADAAEPNLATLTAPLPVEESAGKPNPPQPWRHGALLPVVVVLRNLTAQLPAAGEPVGADNVWRYLCNELRLAAQEDFAPAQIKAFVGARYAHMAQLQRLTATDAESRAELLLRQVQHNPRVAELAQRPLLLTLFARLQTDEGGNLPERREELHDAAVELLLNVWERMKPSLQPGAEPGPSLTEWLAASREAIRKELDRLAFEAHRDQQDLQGSADIRQADLIAALLRASANPDARAGQLQICLRDRAGILVEHGVEMVQFPHRTFQEYLAACHLANDDYPDKLAALLRADPQRWREVTLLAAAHAARGNAEHPTWLLAEELCPRTLDEGAASADAWGALLAGQVVAAAGQHVACSRKPQVSPWRAWAVRPCTLASSSPKEIAPARQSRTSCRYWRVKMTTLRCTCLAGRLASGPPDRAGSGQAA